MKKNFTKIRSIYRRKKNRENRKKSNFWKIIRFLSNLLEYYFRLVSICSYETPCVCSYGIGKPWKIFPQKSPQYVAVKNIVKIGKSKFFGKFFVFVSNLLEYYFRLVSICRYETPCVLSYDIGKPRKKNSQKSAQYIDVKKTWKSKKVKFLDDSPFFVQLTRILFPIDFNLQVWNSICLFIWYR